MSAEQLDRIEKNLGDLAKDIEKKLNDLTKDVSVNRKALYSALKVVHAAAFVSGALEFGDLDKNNPKDKVIIKCRKLLDKLTEEFWRFIEESGMDASEFPVIQTNVIYEGLEI